MLQALADEIREINADNGWDLVYGDDWDNDDVNKIPAKLGLVMCEAAEAIEAFRTDDYVNFKEELADVLIRTLSLAGGIDPDIDATVRAKLARNRTRGYRHGGKRV